MSDYDYPRYLRMTIDVCVFEDAKEFGRKLVKEGKGSWGTGERIARELMKNIEAGVIEIDEVRDVEDHT